jgi:hypothetical protein
MAETALSSTTAVPATQIPRNLKLGIDAVFPLMAIFRQAKYIPYATEHFLRIGARPKPSLSPAPGFDVPLPARDGFSFSRAQKSQGERP